MKFSLALRLLLLLTLVGGVGVLASVGGEAIGTTFATNGINLKIDSKAWYNGVPVPSATWALKDLDPYADHFFDYDDIKPGDFGCNVISMHVKNQDAWMCLDFKNLESEENGVNEPEGEVEPGGAGGELLDGTEFFGWVDDGDGVYEPPQEKALFGTSTQSAGDVLDETTYIIGDSAYGGSCKVNKTKYVGMCWCAGNLVVNANGSMTCDPETIGNEAQTDSWSVDVSIRAEPIKDKPKFVCKKEDDPPKGPDEECKAAGFDFAIAKYEWQGGWVLDGSILSPYLLFVLGTAQSVSWTATPAVGGVVGKTGGQGIQTQTFPGGTAGTIHAWKPVAQNPTNFHDISHITFCGRKTESYSNTPKNWYGSWRFSFPRWFSGFHY
ncbi:MAG: hypothetical protein WBK28_00155 [Minisyncoccia bacterium]